MKSSSTDKDLYAGMGELHRYRLFAYVVYTMLKLDIVTITDCPDSLAHHVYAAKQNEDFKKAVERLLVKAQEPRKRFI